MALEDISNRVDEMDDHVRVYCAHCGDPDGELGWAYADMVVPLEWKRVEDELYCTAYCALRGSEGLDHEDALNHPARAAEAKDDPITEEAVAAMNPVVVPAELNLDSIEVFDASVQEEGGE